MSGAVQVFTVGDDPAGELFPGQGGWAVGDDDVTAVPAPHDARGAGRQQPLGTCQYATCPQSVEDRGELFLTTLPFGVAGCLFSWQ
jgi:hypothetical protein